MASIREFFRRGESETVPALDTQISDSTQIFAPGTRILYDPNLIKKLISDHRNLVAVYTDLNKAIQKGQFQRIHALLGIFLALFNEHALTEYTKLYVFLDYSLRDYHEDHDLVMKFRKEMQEIGKVVRLFVHQWRDRGVDASNLESFSAQVQDIGKVLSKRINVEEQQLYEIYANAPELLIPVISNTH